MAIQQQLEAQLQSIHQHNMDPRPSGRHSSCHSAAAVADDQLMRGVHVLRRQIDADACDAFVGLGCQVVMRSMCPLCLLSSSNEKKKKNDEVILQKRKKSRSFGWQFRGNSDRRHHENSRLDPKNGACKNVPCVHSG
jgi:hypothetical protein